MPPKTSIWPIDGHTRGKHLVLQNYLAAWLPIMASRNQRILFIDGFAGPGEYAGGEIGSPLLAIRALANHSALGQMKGSIHFVFIEEDESRASHLDALMEVEEVPSVATYQTINSTFDGTLTGVLDDIDAQRARLAPAFVMIDPFGFSGTPMRVIRRILDNPQSEVYVTFMYDAIRRFAIRPEIAFHLDEQFGCGEWRHGIEISDPVEKKNFYFDLYRSQLKSAGAVHVLHFELYDGDRLVYAIFFGTQSLSGSDNMKKAMWKVAPFGDFRFKGGLDEQLTFGGALVNYGRLGTSLRQRFGTKEWVDIGVIADFVKSDRTEFHSGQLKRDTLRPLEQQGRIEVRRRTTRRSGSFPKGTKIRFCE